MSKPPIHGKNENYTNVLYITKWLWTDLGRSVWVTGILSNNMKFPSHECYITFFSLTKYNDNPQSIKLSTKLWPFYRTRPFTELWEVSIEYIWCGMGTGDAYSSGHMVPPHLGLAYALLVETNPFPGTCRHFSGQCYSNIPLYFLNFAFISIYTEKMCFIVFVFINWALSVIQ